MSEEKRMILEMLNNGDISVDEAERLLAAIPEEPENNVIVHTNNQTMQPKRLKIIVTNNDTGKVKVDMRIPFSLIRAGLKIGKASIAMGAKFDKDGNSDTGQILEYLKDIDVDEILSSLDDGEITLPYTMIDMDSNEDGENVHIDLVLE